MCICCPVFVSIGNKTQGTTNSFLITNSFQAVIFVACCSMSTDRVQVAQCLMTQLFDDYDCESCNVADKQHLENVHDEGRVKLNQILATNDKLRLTNLSAEQLSSQMYHNAMCKILEGFFKGIDDALPPPTIIQVCNVIIANFNPDVEYRLFKIFKNLPQLKTLH